MATTIERITDVDTLFTVYDTILEPSFQDDELVTVETIIDNVRHGVDDVFVAFEDDAPAALTLGHWYPEPKVALLGYLAVRPGVRGAGLGGAVLRHYIEHWSTVGGAELVLAEAERPDVHPADPDHGDPEARLRFYARHGARALALPHFVPALRPDSAPVWGFLLMTLYVAKAARGSSPDSVDCGRVRDFLSSYLDDDHGPAAHLLMYEAGRAADIPSLPLSDYAQIPAARGLGRT
ncbi:MAG TPA: GNAT family N-acetyltransferase [Stackebrandtia sp.]|uniref:GNAT family N-acetyltransferase n=1 Tax=Stackebrandtia sp. TaxID=2023065 RepID=UPI002D6AA5F3|nr:GNAT family N-acetyltransferase [Stackebrandtia sp.]HZE40454.1 GNAT family N-acetyltransferase [Stackebrandtia sp.]